ncbi:MAG: cyclomaltodextrinase C-terminal domain-containing protein, partial [Flavobacteriaceae bacterium]
IKIYDGLANDFHYPNPKAIMAMMDNHDMSRIYTELKGDIVQTKMALSTLLMLPRIPQIYYGTEILMQDFDKPGDHGLIRTDFPGGWASDQINVFTGEGLNEDQKNMQNYLKTLLNFRKNSAAIHHGKTVHFAPNSGVYFLFRKIEDEIVFLILNKNEKPVSVDLNRFKELNFNGKTFQNVLTKEVFMWQDTLRLPKKGSYIFSLTPK